MKNGAPLFVSIGESPNGWREEQTKLVAGAGGGGHHMYQKRYAPLRAGVRPFLLPPRRLLKLSNSDSSDSSRWHLHLVEARAVKG